MELEVPYNYINLLAFLTAMKYENIRRIKIKDLNAYRVNLLYKVLDDYNNLNTVFEGKKDQWEGDVEFSYVDEKQALRNFVKEYSHILYLDGDTIYLNDDVDFKMLNHEVIEAKKEAEVGQRFAAVSQDKDLLHILGITKIEKLLNIYLKIEEKIESCYMNLFNDDAKELEKERNKNLLMRMILLHNLKNSVIYFVDAFRLVASNLYFDDLSYEYDDYPLSLDFLENSEFYSKDVEDLFTEFDDRLYEIYQYAIFGDNSLSLQKLWDMIDNLYFFEMPIDEELLDMGLDMDEDIEEDIDELAENLDEELEEEIEEENEDDYLDIGGNPLEDNVFYLNYINKIDQYMDEYGADEELLKVKKRLLYVLDKPGLGLYKRENFERELLKANNEEMVDNAFNFIENEIRFMASEVFLAPEDNNTLKKLLLISTYCSLVEDDSIKEIMDNYSNHDKYTLYNRVVFGDEKDKVKLKR